MNTKEDRISSDYVNEHQMYYNIYYNELNLFYQKTTIFTSFQLAFFTGLILKYDEIAQHFWMMTACLIFLINFSVIQLLVSIRGFNVNNAVIETISKFEKDNDFDFLEQFNTNVNRGHRIGKMNFPSLMIIGTNILFLFVWTIISVYFYGNKLTTLNIEMHVCENLVVEDHWYILVISALFALTMKIADLLDEHGLQWFKFADILFGILWGIFWALLVIEDKAVANVIMAMMVGFVVRKRLDYINHIIAFCIIISTFIFYSQGDFKIFFPFVIVITILGLIKDLKYNSNKSEIQKVIEKIYLYIPIIYAIPSLIYSMFTNNWLVFITFFTYDFVYNITRIISKKRKWYQEGIEGEPIVSTIGCSG